MTATDMGGAMDMPETRTSALLSTETGAAGAERIPARRMFGRFVLDFVLALFVFGLCTGLFAVGPGNAFPAPPPPELTVLPPPLPAPAMFIAIPVFPGSVTRAPDSLQALGLLALAFAALTAANLAIGRHVWSTCSGAVANHNGANHNDVGTA